MYVRWVVRRHKSDEAAEIAFFDAYLVESYRDGKGTPRQRTICYLGNVREIAGTFPAIERALFLIRAKSILDGTASLSTMDRQFVTDLLHDKVPPLTAAELQIAAGINRQWFDATLRGSADQARRVENDLLNL